jgi:hypothetical protein
MTYLVPTYPLTLERRVWYFCDDNSKSGSATIKCRHASLRDELWSYGTWGVSAVIIVVVPRSLARIMAILLLDNSPPARAAARFCAQNYWKQPGTFRTLFGPRLSFNCQKGGSLYWNIENDLSTSNWLQKRERAVYLLLCEYCIFIMGELALLSLMTIIHTPEGSTEYVLWRGEGKAQNE